MKGFLVFFVFLLLCSFVVCESSKDRYLTLPKPKLCESRFKEATYMGRNFFYSGHDPKLKDERLDWLDARNTCRDRCMEPLSFETQAKFDFYKAYVEKNNISFFWTSGRLCDFEGCEGRWDLIPKRIKGWLWSANQVPISPTNKIPPGWSYQPWSGSGSRNRSQPDNAEFYLSQTSESCLGVLNNMYNDSVSWHDIACYHRARFICEDSELLLDDVKNGLGEPETTESVTQATTTTVKTTSQLPKESTTTASLVKTTAQLPEETTTSSPATSTTTSAATTTRSSRRNPADAQRRRNSRRKVITTQAPTTPEVVPEVEQAETTPATVASDDSLLE